MRALVLSDSHRDVASCLMALKKHPKVDFIIHLGDGEDDLDELFSYTIGKKVVCVRGNCSLGSLKADRQIIEIGGKKVYCCHGHIEGVKTTLDGLIAYAIAEGCELALFGHTHRQKYLCLNEPTLHMFNPGSIRAGEYGIVDIGPEGIVCIKERL